MSLFTVKAQAGGEMIVYVRTHPKFTMEVCCYDPHRHGTGVVLDERQAFDLIGIMGAYRESSRRAMGYPVDDERRDSEKPMSLWDALWQAWYTIRHRKAVGSLKLETQALEADLIRLRGAIDAQRARLHGGAFTGSFFDYAAKAMSQSNPEGAS